FRSAYAPALMSVVLRRNDQRDSEPSCRTACPVAESRDRRSPNALRSDRPLLEARVLEVVDGRQLHGGRSDHRLLPDAVGSEAELDRVAARDPDGLAAVG